MNIMDWELSERMETIGSNFFQFLISIICDKS